jgi:hypothetical protein
MLRSKPSHLEFDNALAKNKFAASCVTISNPNPLSSCSETRVNPGIRTKKAKKSIYLNELNVRKPLVVSISQRSEELRLYSLVLNLEI